MLNDDNAQNSTKWTWEPNGYISCLDICQKFYIKKRWSHERIDFLLIISCKIKRLPISFSLKKINFHEEKLICSLRKREKFKEKNSIFFLSVSCYTRGRRGCTSRFLASVWHAPSFSGHLGNEPTDGRFSLFPFLHSFLSHSLSPSFCLSTK